MKESISAEDEVLRLRTELEAVKKERDGLRLELEVAQRFHDVAVLERDRERISSDSLRSKLEVLQKLKFGACGLKGCRAVSHRVGDDYCRLCLIALHRRNP